MNIMILFLSEYKDIVTEALYQCDLEATEIRGIQTSDAPTKYFLQYVKQNKNDKLDKIFCITSKKVKNYGLEQYKSMIAEYCKNNNLHQPEVIPIAYDFNLDAVKEEKVYELSEKVNQLYQGIVEKLTNVSPQSKPIHLYIDYTGGLRDVNLFIIVLIRYLEFMQMKCEKVIYTNWDDKKIVSLDYVYKLFHVINGISEFIQSGSSVLLKDTVLRDEEMEKRYPQIRTLLDSMQEFSNIMALCIVDGRINEVLKRLNQSIEEVQKMDVSENDETEIAISMLKNLLKEIQKKLLLDQSQELSYLQIIKWCLNNNMIQQAITFYIEKVPQIYYENNLINWIDKENRRLDGHDKYSKQFYDILYDEIRENEYKMLKIFQKIIEEIPQEGQRVNLEEFFGKFTSQCSELKQEEREKIKKGVEKVLTYLDFKYAPDRETKIDNKMYEYLNKELEQAKDVKTICNIIGKNFRIRQFLMGIPIVEKENTYQKKLRSIGILNDEGGNSFSSISNSDLKEILEYFLVLKVIRNQINHANEAEREEISFVDKYLQDNQKGYSTNIDVENIKTILNSAIDKTEQLIVQNVEQSEDEFGDFDKVNGGEKIKV